MHTSWHTLLQGFDEYMNVVLDDAEEVHLKSKERKAVGRIMLKGDNITYVGYMCCVIQDNPCLLPRRAWCEHVPTGKHGIAENGDVLPTIARVVELSCILLCVVSTQSVLMRLHN